MKSKLFFFLAAFFILVVGSATSGIMIARALMPKTVAYINADTAPGPEQISGACHCCKSKPEPVVVPVPVAAPAPIPTPVNLPSAKLKNYNAAVRHTQDCVRISGRFIELMDKGETTREQEQKFLRNAYLGWKEHLVVLQSEDGEIPPQYYEYYGNDTNRCHTIWFR